MHINPNSPNQKSGVPAKSAGSTGAGQVSANPVGPGRSELESGIGDLVGQLPIGSLVELMNSTSEIRAVLVEKAREKLAVGEYLLPEAAEKTADAILGLPVADLNQSP